MRRALLPAALLLSGCAATTDDGRERAPFRVVIQPYLPFAPLYVAQAEGIFAQYDLTVEFVRMPASEPAIPLLLDGSVDILLGHAAPGVFNAIARGERIRIVAERSRRAPARCSTLALVARPGLLDDARPAGAPPHIRRISVDRQAAMLFFVEKALSSVGIALDTLERVAIPHAAEPHALASGAIDVALAGEPFLSRTLRAGHGVPWIGLEDVLPGIEFSVLIFGRRLLERQRDAGARFIAAFLEANRRLAEGRTPRNLALVGEFLHEDPAALAEVCWPFQPSDGQIRTDYLMEFQQWQLERGWIDAVAGAGELIDAGLLERARRSMRSVQ